MSSTVSLKAGGLGLEISGYLQAGGDVVLVLTLGGDCRLRIRLEGVVDKDRRVSLPRADVRYVCRTGGMEVLS